MYERNAIVLERYFNKKFGYDFKNNLKTNFNDYFELIEQLELYKNAADEEDNIIKEYDSIADKIRETQAVQEKLNKKNQQLQEERKEIFRNIDENSESIKRKTANVNNSINELNKEIEDNAQKFVEIITEFNEKSTIRTSCERNRRKVENEYNKRLNQTLDNFQDIDKSIVDQAKRFSETDTENIEDELANKIEKNGEKEKIPFNEEVISKAIMLAVDIQKKETDVLTNVYDKMSRLFNEIKNNTVKIDKHKKIVKDSKVKLEFLSALKDYLVQFLDNERITAVNGEEEHKSLMKEACKNLDLDLKQVNNLYTILLKEISNKVGKKTYDELYNYDYLIDLENISKSFDEKVKNINLPVTIINPNYWRIDGMRKIYETFDNDVTKYYGRDLSEYIITEEENLNEEDEDEDENNTDDSSNTSNISNDDSTIKNKEKEEISEEIKEELDPKSEIDKKIEMILGMSKRNLREEIDLGKNENEENIDDDETEIEKDSWEEDSGLDDDFDEEVTVKEEKITENEEDDNWDDEDDEDDEDDLDEFDFGEDEDIKDIDEENEEDDWENEKDLEDEFDDDIGEIETDEDNIENEDEDTEEEWIEEDDVEEEWDDDNIDQEKLDDDEWNDDWNDDELDEEKNDEDSLKKENEAEESTPDVDIWGKSIKKEKKEDDWENEFINIKEKDKKKKGFFNKFKK